MRNIIICEAISTGYNLVEDVRRRGYNPVVLESPGEESEDVKELREGSYSLFHKRPEIKRAFDNYEETLAMVKSYEPLLVIAGSEQGVYLAAKLSNDLGLLGNPIENIDAMTKKDAMHKALKKAGIRYIRGKVVDNAETAIVFCRENGFKQAVVKPVQSAGSQGLFLCDDLDEVKKAVETVLTYKDLYGRPIKSALVQERINGTEYIVNTISCNGEHVLNSILRYAKLKTEEGGYIYDYCETINTLEQGHTRLVEYAFQVADATGFKYGTIHGEYMIDETGPVLIEVNCRPMVHLSLTFILSSLVSEPSSSVSFTIKVKVPAFSGVPDILPSADKLRPSGSSPDFIVHLTLPVVSAASSVLSYDVPKFPSGKDSVVIAHGIMTGAGSPA